MILHFWPQILSVQAPPLAPPSVRHYAMYHRKFFNPSLRFALPCRALPQPPSSPSFGPPWFLDVGDLCSATPCRAMELQQGCAELAEQLADLIMQYWAREIQLLKQHLAYLKQCDAVPLFVRGQSAAVQLLEQQLRMELAEQLADLILLYCYRELQLLKQHLGDLKQRDAGPLGLRVQSAAVQLHEQQLRTEVAELCTEVATEVTELPTEVAEFLKHKTSLRTAVPELQEGKTYLTELRLVAAKFRRELAEFQEHKAELR